MSRGGWSRRLGAERPTEPWTRMESRSGQDPPMVPGDVVSATFES